jgi:carboxyl-terminal processing protease
MQPIDNNKQETFLIKMPLWFGLCVAIGIIIGVLIGRPSQKSTYQQAKRVEEVLNLIQNSYVEDVRLDTITERGIQKILQNLDPHSAYFPPEDAAMAKSQLETDFEGVGIEYEWIRDTLFVTYPIPQSPADKAGILAGDKMIAINGEKIVGEAYSPKKLFGMLRGKKGTDVTLTLLRGENIKEITVTRDKIRSRSVYAYLVMPKVGYLKITKFAEKTDTEFSQALEKLVKQHKIEKLILDLRDNGGGFMEKANKIADEFLQAGELIVYTQGKQKRFNQKYFATQGGLFEQGKIILLIDEGSASASEILAGALQDNDRAVLIGRRSYGKGLVQQPFELSDGAELRLTVSKYYSPSGRCIQRDYKNGKPYDKNLMERFKNGELIHQDSIHYDKKQVFKTKKGKKVYGGGGISPDYFVALDTFLFNQNLNNALKTNRLREYATHYVQTSQKELEKMGLEKYLAEWELEEKILQKLLGEAYPKLSESQLRYLKNYCKAYIAKIIWGHEAFIQVENSQDEVFLKALEICKNNQQ